MDAKEGVVDRLNSVLVKEMTAIHQYLVQSKKCSNWGFVGLGKALAEKLVDEQEDAERLIEHILYLEGEPNMQTIGSVYSGDRPLHCLEYSLNSEKEVVATLAQAIAHCHSVGDYTTRGMLEEMIIDEEKHVDWFETQFSLIDRLGLELYLAQFVRD